MAMSANFGDHSVVGPVRPRVALDREPGVEGWRAGQDIIGESVVAEGAPTLDDGPSTLLQQLMGDQAGSATLSLNVEGAIHHVSAEIEGDTDGIFDLDALG